MILGHNVWSGGVLPVVVTLTGWLIFAKGVMLLALTPETLQTMMHRMDYQANAQLYVLPALAIGAYLSWAGFTSEARRH
jgi:prepilin signal peptidase PulO-like enzyme (type II secretory pathway)